MVTFLPDSFGGSADQPLITMEWCTPSEQIQWEFLGPAWAYGGLRWPESRHTTGGAGLSTTIKMIERLGLKETVDLRDLPLQNDYTMENDLDEPAITYVRTADGWKSFIEANDPRHMKKIHQLRLGESHADPLKEIYQKYVSEKGDELRNGDWIVITNQNSRVCKSYEEAIQYKPQGPNASWFCKEYHRPDSRIGMLYSAIGTFDETKCAYIKAVIKHPDTEVKREVKMLVDPASTHSIGPQTEIERLRLDRLTGDDEQNPKDGLVRTGKGLIGIKFFDAQIQVGDLGTKRIPIGHLVPLVSSMTRKQRKASADDYGPPKTEQERKEEGSWILGQSFLGLCKHQWLGNVKMTIELLEPQEPITPIANPLIGANLHNDTKTEL